MKFTANERSLLLRYGYPFNKLKSELEACSKSSGTETVSIERFELTPLIGDLCYSINRMKAGGLLDELLDLCDRLEPVEHSADGGVDTA